ncbi:hypothetical protein M885DRAFT_625965 [Pelagophyceae sp. CCMP2097]|nr:hypothetical protein M885DRAFT_625965 [Pelagophyceae sp. CCMP2097]
MPALDEAEVRAALWQQQQQGRAPSRAAAPVHGADLTFDARVETLARMKRDLRREVWAALGGAGEPAEPGALRDFDARVEKAFDQLRASRADGEQRRFEDEVEAEMGRLVHESYEALRRSEPRSDPRGSAPQARSLPPPPGGGGTREPPGGYYGGGGAHSQYGHHGHHAGPGMADPRQQDPRQADPRQADPRQADPRPANTQRRFTAQRTASSIVFG